MIVTPKVCGFDNGFITRSARCGYVVLLRCEALLVCSLGELFKIVRRFGDAGLVLFRHTIVNDGYARPGDRGLPKQHFAIPQQTSLMEHTFRATTQQSGERARAGNYYVMTPLHPDPSHVSRIADS
jgi:hypothetical protein